MPGDDRFKAMTFSRPEAVPVGVSILPAAWMRHRERLDEVVARHPAIFGQVKPNPNYDAVGGTYVAGKHIDEWGCVWENVHSGNEAIVTGHPLPNRSDVHKLRRPTATDGGFRHGFMYLRLQDLRGFEELMLDFAEEPPELAMLIDAVLQYNLEKAAILMRELKAEDPMVYFGDDLGMQTSLPMSPEKWRKYLKPCFRAIYRPFKDAGKYLYMHTDGHLVEIVDDLVECGVNVLNLQYRANGLENLARTCRGKVCVDLDLDRQLFPFATPEQLDRHVRECVAALATPEGGLWLGAEINEDVPVENVEAICAALARYRWGTG
jgi:hypothetical protein